MPNMEEKKQEFLQSLAVTPEQAEHIMNEPQRTDLWKKHRQGRMTASNYGTAAGHNKYSTPRKLLMNLLWEDFKGNAATEHGTKYEPVAAQFYEKWIQQMYQLPHDHPHRLKIIPPAMSELVFDSRPQVDYPGLMVCPELPWLAVSPDGLPRMNGLKFLLEIKCPFSKQLYPYIPHYYFDQIQGIMAILKLPFCDFVVWTPQSTQIRRYKYDPIYWEKVLMPKLQHFYMNEYLPRIILKQNGLLLQGQLEPKTFDSNPTEDDVVIPPENPKHPKSKFIW